MRFERIAHGEHALGRIDVRMHDFVVSAALGFLRKKIRVRHLDIRKHRLAFFGRRLGDDVKKPLIVHHLIVRNRHRPFLSDIDHDGALLFFSDVFSHPTHLKNPPHRRGPVYLNHEPGIEKPFFSRAFCRRGDPSPHLTAPPRDAPS